MKIEKLGIVGCGLMGAGIAQVAAQAGYTTVVREINAELLEKGLNHISAFLEKGVEKGCDLVLHPRYYRPGGLG